MPDMPVGPADLSAETLAGIFNRFAARAQQDHPRLKDEFLILDNTSGKLYGTFDRSTKYTFISDEDFDAAIRRLAEEVKKVGSHATKIGFKMSELNVSAGHLVSFQRNKPMERMMGRERPEEYALLFTLYHELGHHVVKDSMTAGTNAEGRNFSETAADIYATIRMRQHFPEEKEDFFTKRVLLRRSMSMAENGHTSHYTAFAIDELVKAAKQVDLLALTPEQAAEFAWNMAAKYSLAAPVQFRLSDGFREFREERKADPQAALRKLAEKTLAEDNMQFRAGMHYLAPFLDGWAKHPQYDVSGDYWDGMRAKLKARAQAFAQDDILSGFPKRAQPKPAAPSVAIP